MALYSTHLLGVAISRRENSQTYTFYVLGPLLHLSLLAVLVVFQVVVEAMLFAIAERGRREKKRSG